MECCLGFRPGDLAEGVDGLVGKGSSVVVFQVGGYVVDGMDECRHCIGVSQKP